jgi:hypothetical protein
MSYHEDVELLERYMPLISAELRRIGVSAEDERWIHAGTNQRPTEELAKANLAAVRALPTNMGVRAYCNWLGFDYDDAKRKLAAHSTPPNEEL